MFDRMICNSTVGYQADRPLLRAGGDIPLPGRSACKRFGRRRGGRDFNIATQTQHHGFVAGICPTCCTRRGKTDLQKTPPRYIHTYVYICVASSYVQLRYDPNKHVLFTLHVYIYASRLVIVVELPLEEL